MPRFPTTDGDPDVDVILRMARSDVRLIANLLSKSYHGSAPPALDAATSNRLMYLLADLHQWLDQHPTGVSVADAITQLPWPLSMLTQTK